MNIRSHPENVLAVASLLFSASMWGLIWYPLRLLDDAGMSAVWSSLIMYLAAAVLAVPMLFKQYKLIPDNFWELMAFALAAGITNVAFVVALIEGEVMRVMLLFYLSPLWTVIIGRWWLGERLSPAAKAMFAVAMSGSLVMLWNPQIGWPWPHGLADWLALIGSVAFSINNVLARKLASVPMGLKTGIVWWGVVVVSVLVLFWQKTAMPSVDVQVWTGAGLLGLLGIVPMTIAVLYGVARMPVYRSSVIMLFELVVAAVAAWWLTEEAMATQEWIGGVLIILAAYGVAKAAVLDE
jgi:drug/metabolite transporter (DMT)-like permease